MKKLFVAFAAVMMVTAFASTTIAGDWNFYGSARVSYWLINRDTGQTTVPNQDETNARFQLQNNSRLGARVKGGKVYGRFEFGINPDNDNLNAVLDGDNAGSAATPGIYTRLLFGAWNFGAGTLVVGQDYTPEYLGISTANMATGSDSVMLGRGVPYTGRRAQVRLEFGGFQFAVVDNTGGSNLGTTTSTGAVGNTQMTIPKLAARYTFKYDPVSFDIAGSYQTYDIKRGAWSDLSVDAYYIGLRGTAKLGPFGVKGVVYMNQNGNEMAFSSNPADGAIVVNPNAANARVVDNDTVGFAITANYKVNDMIQFEAGYGYQASEQDDANENGLSGSGARTKDDNQAYYLNAQITLAPGVFIVPEIGIDDFKKNNQGTDQGDKSWFGAKFQIDF